MLIRLTKLFFGFNFRMEMRNVIISVEENPPRLKIVLETKLMFEWA